MNLVQLYTTKSFRLHACLWKRCLYLWFYSYSIMLIYLKINANIVPRCTLYSLYKSAFFFVIVGDGLKCINSFQCSCSWICWRNMGSTERPQAGCSWKSSGSPACLSPCNWKTGDSMACTMVNLIFLSPHSFCKSGIYVSCNLNMC